MTKGQRWRMAVCLAAVLIASASGCYPATSTNTGSAPAAPKPDKQPDKNKDKPVKQPPPDVG